MSEYSSNLCGASHMYLLQLMDTSLPSESWGGGHKSGNKGCRLPHSCGLNIHTFPSARESAPYSQVHVCVKESLADPFTQRKDPQLD